VAREFKLPDIGEGLTEAEIVRWLVQVGDSVDADQPVVEVETDKAVVEIPTPFAGVVLELGGAEGETVEVGSVLLVIGEPGEESGGDPGSDSQSGKQDEEEDPQEEDHPGPASAAAPIVGTLSDEAESLAAGESVADASEASQVKALPVVRKLARDHGIDLATVEGSGPGGRITRQDVERLIETPRPAAGEEETARRGVAAAEPAEPEVEEVEVEEHLRPPAAAVDERRPMSRLRRTIAANMSKSWSEIPHVTTFDDVDATRLLEVRDALGERHETRIPLEALVIRAVVPALHAYPEFNSTIDGDDLVFHGRHDIGIAVDTPDGLMVAVIRDAASMGVLQLASEVRRLGEGARERSLTPDELSGQTFTLSNIGAVGGGHGTPIVPPGTTAILSLGRAKERPIVFGDDIVIAPVMPLSLSYDHRVIDGAVGRRFMAMLIENLEEPALFLAG
jgi:pyruvate dehydrogenase E2 component (dihydrolipoamide acetyltransferase)